MPRDEHLGSHSLPVWDFSLSYSFFFFSFSIAQEFYFQRKSQMILKMRMKMKMTPQKRTLRMKSHRLREGMGVQKTLLSQS